MPQHLQDNYGKNRYVVYVTSYRRNDAIVKPGQEGASHLHVFFNSHINTPTISISDLTIGKFTNDGGTVDGSAYWMPAMIDISDNSIIPYPMAKTPSGILTYIERNYRRSRFSIIEPFPKDLRMVVGNANATTAQWTNPNASNAFFSYQCKSPTGSALSIEQATIPACAQGNKLTIKFITPSCYDGRLDSPDHISHTRWITNWRCQQWSTGTVKISGTPGTVIPLNTALTTVTGIQYLTQAQATIGTGGTANSNCNDCIVLSNPAGTRIWVGGSFGSAPVSTGMNTWAQLDQNLSDSKYYVTSETFPNLRLMNNAIATDFDNKIYARGRDSSTSIHVFDTDNPGTVTSTSINGFNGLTGNFYFNLFSSNTNLYFLDVDQEIKIIKDRKSVV